MQKTFMLGCLLISSMCQLRAQSINNNTWKAYIGDPINDTAIFHIYSDSSFDKRQKLLVDDIVSREQHFEKLRPDLSSK
jgi:hypothetical protein